MAPETLAALLKLPPGERVDLALGRWASRDEAQRGAELYQTPAQAEELDRRLAEHLASPGSAIPWAEVRRKISRSS
jgi:putative addiction module component (TIGR02574 family)